MTLEAEAGVNSLSSDRSATVRFYTADNGTELLTPPNGHTFFTLYFTQSGTTGGGMESGQLQLTVLGGAEYEFIIVKFELYGGVNLEFTYDSRTTTNPTKYDIHLPNTYTPYLVSAEGYIGAAQGTPLNGSFDKTTVTIPGNGVGYLTLTLTSD